MKLTPINEQNIANISSNRYNSKFPSMFLDNRNFPHIVWTEQAEESYVLAYRFWDGLKWSFLGKSYVIAKSSKKILNYQQNIVINKEQNPIVCFGEEKEIGGYISLAYGRYDKWEIKKYDADYAIKWTGIITIERQYEFSSSSSSSSKNYSESSSISESNSSKSISDSSNSSGSTSSISSDSSSIESRSSDSYDNEILFVSTIDENNLLRIYELNNDVLNMIAQKQINGSWENFKIMNCGNYIGFSFLINNYIYYDFWDVNNEQFLNSIWVELTETNGIINDYDAQGGIAEDYGIILFAWCENHQNTSCIKSKIAFSNEIQKWTYSGSIYLEQKNKTNVQAVGFSVDATKKVACCIEDELYHILSMGGQNVIFTTNGTTIKKDTIDVCGFNNFKPMSTLANATNNTMYCVLENYSNIYFLKGEIRETEPSYNIPQFSILSSQRYKSGNLIGNSFYGIETMCVWDNKTGDILREAKNKIVVTANENNDPLCESSSSSSSTSSSESSISSKSSVTYNIVSSSSIGYSESTQGNSETSDGFTDGQSTGYEPRNMPPLPSIKSGFIYEQLLSQDETYKIVMGYQLGDSTSSSE